MFRSLSMGKVLRYFVLLFYGDVVGKKWEEFRRRYDREPEGNSLFCALYDKTGIVIILSPRFIYRRNWFHFRSLTRLGVSTTPPQRTRLSTERKKFKRRFVLTVTTLSFTMSADLSLSAQNTSMLICSTKNWINF